MATDTLAAQGLSCRRLQVRQDTSQFALPPGTPATVEVTVTCEVSFTDIAFAGLPSSRTVTASFVSPIDTWRGRR